MKNFEILDLFMGLRNLAGDASRTFPGKIAFAFSRNLKKLQPIVEDIDKARAEVIKKYGVEVEPEKYNIPEQAQAQFSDEMDALMDVEEEVTLSMIKFTDIENLSFSVGEIDALTPMISEED